MTRFDLHLNTPFNGPSFLLTFLFYIEIHFDLFTSFDRGLGSDLIEYSISNTFEEDKMIKLHILKSGHLVKHTF